MVDLLSKLLSMEGFDVEALTTDADILRAIGKAPPDVLLLDMVFGEHNGLEVLDRVRRLPAGNDVCVIMFSGLSVREECLQHGADDFLLKPFMPDDLMKLLRNHLQSPA